MLLHYGRGSVPVELMQELWAMENRPVAMPAAENYDGFSCDKATRLMVHLNHLDHVVVKIEYREVEDALLILCVKGVAIHQRKALDAFEVMARQCGYDQINAKVHLTRSVSDAEACRTLNLFRGAGFTFQATKWGAGSSISFGLIKVLGLRRR